MIPPEAKLKEPLREPFTPSEKGEPTPFSLLEEDEDEEGILALNDELLDSIKAMLQQQKQSIVTSTPLFESLKIESSQLLSTLIDKMIAQLTYVHTSGIQETTLILNAPDFANSPFFGCSIKITEYSTAPKIFNVTLLLTPAALSLIQPQVQSLWKTLQKEELGFGVGRLDLFLNGEEEESKEKEEDKR